jgi:hypothetical protein
MIPIPRTQAVPVVLKLVAGLMYTDKKPELDV